MINLKQAKDIIEELKLSEAERGRDMSTWHFYSNHIEGAANAAKAIAEKTTNINPERIYIASLLHDVAKFEQDYKTKRFHGILGYERFADTDSYVARACLLHQFYWNKLPPFERAIKIFFDNKADYDFTKNYIDKTKVNDDDLLIQLSDTLATKDGIVTIEERAKEYEERTKTKIPEDMIKSVLALKAYFDKKIGQDIYNVIIKSK